MSNHYPISNEKKAFYIKIGQASKIQWYNSIHKLTQRVKFY